MRQGILVVDKPEGFTSHDVVAKMRGLLKMKKIGHAGTLDPMATGVLPLFLGSGTKACHRMPHQDKAYVGRLQLGIETDTQDITGKILKEHSVTSTKEDLEQMLPEFTGTILQIPPMFSAVQIDGKRLYELARKGEEVHRPSREITIYELNLLDYNEKEHWADLYVHCSSGTYIRTLAHDLGQRLGVGGTLSRLRRVNSNGFQEEESHTLEEIQTCMDHNSIESLILPVERVFLSYPAVVLEEPLATYYLNGVPLWLNQGDLTTASTGWVRLKSTKQEFLGIGYVDREKRQLVQHTKFF